MNIYAFSAKTIDGREQPLSEYRDHVLLIVNTASGCGFTPQYEGLERLYETYRNRKFAVLGFPCNQFGSQESGSETEIKAFCEVKFGVKFPMFAKIDVNGANAHPLYQYLSKAKPGILNSTSIKWNFTKFLIDRQGLPQERYSPLVKPESLKADIEKLL